MSVDLEPGDLGFRRMSQFLSSNIAISINTNDRITGPFNREVSEVLHIRNPQSDPIAFKVRLYYPCAVSSPFAIHLLTAALF